MAPIWANCDEGVGEAIPITLILKEAVTVSGTPTLTLNDGGTTGHDAAHSSATSLVFDYTVASGQTTNWSRALILGTLLFATLNSPRAQDPGALPAGKPNPPYPGE